MCHELQISFFLMVHEVIYKTTFSLLCVTGVFYSFIDSIIISNQYEKSLLGDVVFSMYEIRHLCNIGCRQYVSDQKVIIDLVIV